MAIRIAACAFCVAAATFIARAQPVGPNVNLSKATGNQYETAVAIDPTNANRIFVVARNEVGGLATARSGDGGATWTRRMMGVLNPPPAGDVPRAYGNASVAWDEHSNLFMVYLSQSSLTAPTYVTLALSTDGGATFYAPTGGGAAIILPPGPPYTSGDQPTVAVGPGSAGALGSIWVTFWSIGGIWVSSAAVNGTGSVGAFTSAPLPSQPTSVNFGDIAVGPNGEAMVTYGPNSGSNGTIYTNVDPDGLGPAAFSNYQTAATVNVGGFSGIPAQPQWGIDPEAGLAYDRTNGTHRGRVHLVFTDAPSVGSADTDIFVVHSDDHGATWSSRVRVNDDAGTNSQFLPRISIDQSTGTIGVTWYDARASATNTTAQYFGSFSSDGGATFTPNVRISAGTSDQARSVPALRDADYGDYTGNASAGGKLVAAWGDNSNSTGDNPEGTTNFDVYASVLQGAPAGVGSVPEGPASIASPLTIARGSGGALDLAWSPSCRIGDLDYAVYEGTLGSFQSHVTRLCTTSGATAATIVPSSGSAYYLVVAHGAALEGSYGSGAGAERPPSASACYPQAIGGCP
jgi:hypothetical protein